MKGGVTILNDTEHAVFIEIGMGCPKGVHRSLLWSPVSQWESCSHLFMNDDHGNLSRGEMNDYYRFLSWALEI